MTASVISITSKYLHSPVWDEQNTSGGNILPRGCHRSSGSRCQTSYHSGQPTGSPVLDLPFKTEKHLIKFIFCFLLIFRMRSYTKWKRKIRNHNLSLNHLPATAYICFVTFLSNNLCCFTFLMDGNNHDKAKHFSTRTIFCLRLTNCCSSWERMLVRWAPCMRHSRSAESQPFLWGKNL